MIKEKTEIKHVDVDELEELFKDGWEYVATQRNGKIIIRRIAHTKKKNDTDDETDLRKYFK